MGDFKFLVFAKNTADTVPMQNQSISDPPPEKFNLSHQKVMSLLRKKCGSSGENRLYCSNRDRNRHGQAKFSI
jgi:hypothetical protein